MSCADQENLSGGSDGFLVINILHGGPFGGPPSRSNWRTKDPIAS